MSNIGAMIRPSAYFAEAVGFRAREVSGSSAVNGTGILRVPATSAGGYYIGAKFVLTASTISGSPTAIDLAVTFQTDDNSGFSSATTLTNPDGSALTATLSFSGSPSASDSAVIAVDVPMIHAEEYVRPVVTPTFTGGSAPSVLVAGVFILPYADRW